MLATLGTLAEEMARAEVSPPAIIVVGEVVAVARPGRFEPVAARHDGARGDADPDL